MTRLLREPLISSAGLSPYAPQSTIDNVAEYHNVRSRASEPDDGPHVFFGCQFFGVNHIIEEKARRQLMRFQDINAVVDILYAASRRRARLHVLPNGGSRWARSSWRSAEVGGHEVLPEHAKH